MLNFNDIVYQLPIQVNADKIIKELETLVIPKFNPEIFDYSNLKGKSCNCSITGTATTPTDTWFKENGGPNAFLKDNDTGEILDKLYRQWTLGYPGPRRKNVHGYLDNGVNDRDLTVWPDILLNSELYRVGQEIKKYLNISAVRCRVSFIKGEKYIKPHTDPHTDWRVHINLKSGPDTCWEFSEIGSDDVIAWKQPQGSTWLIRTGTVQHAVRVPRDEERWQVYFHLWEDNLGSAYYQIT